MSRMNRTARRSGRIWLILGILLLLGGAALFFFWPQTGWTGTADLELLALDEQGRFGRAATIPAAWTTVVQTPDGASSRVPLILAIRNAGRRAGEPQRLALSVPVHYRLLSASGRPLPGRTTAGNPLVRYEIEAEFPVVEPGRLPALIPSLDTLWLEPRVPSIYCVALGDSVPEFLPAPPVPEEGFGPLRIFYSFQGEDLRGRQAGLLDLELDAGLLRPETTEIGRTAQSAVIRGPAARPELPSLLYVGSRHSLCGEPQDPLELFTVLWETPAGGRFFVIYHGGAPRKYLFDLNRDSIIDLEVWDPDGRGRFDVARRVSFPIPALLMPVAGPPPFDAAAFAGLSPDSLQRLERFRRPLAVERAPADTSASLDRFRPGVVSTDAPPPTAERTTPATPAQTGPRLLGTPVRPPPR
jgi:hypothetical protein